MFCTISCKHELDTLVPGDGVGFRGNEQIVEASPFAEGMKFSVNKSGLGKTSASVSVAGDPSSVEAYNQANGTDYIALPQEFYGFSESTLKFETKDVTISSTVQWSSASVASYVKTGKCVIPLKLIEAKGAEIMEGRDVLLVHLVPSEIGFENEVAQNVFISFERPDETTIEFANVICIDNPVAEKDITITLEQDNSLIDEFNANFNSASSTPAIQAQYDIVAFPSSVVLQKGETAVSVNCSLNLQPIYGTGSKASLFFDEWVVPIVIKATSDENVIPLQKRMFIHLHGPFDVEEPIGEPHDIMGPWTILEGNELSVVAEYGERLGAVYPEALGCSVDKLVDGDLNTSWWSIWDQENVFPMTFVFDTGAQHIFDMMYLADAPRFQGQYRKYRISVAKTYRGKDTEWTEIASGTKGYDWVDRVNVYQCPVTVTATGRYVKLEIVEPSFDRSKGDYIHGRGRLNEFYGHGI